MLFESLLSVSTAIPAFESYEKLQKARLNRQSYEAVQKLHFAWYMTSIKALMGQLGKELFHKLNPEDQAEFARCLDNIEHQGDLTHGARCLVQARRKRDINPLRKPLKSSFADSTQTNQLRRKTIVLAKPAEVLKPQTKAGIDSLRPVQRLSLADILTIQPNSAFIKPIILHPKIQNQKLHPKISPLYRKRKLQARKDKSKFWQFENYRLRIKRSEHRLLSSREQSVVSVKTMDRLRTLGEAEQPSPIRRVTNLITRITQGKETKYQPGDWMKTYNRLLDYKEQMEEKKQAPGARAFDYRLFDLVLNSDKPTKSPKDKLKPSTFLDTAFDLVDSVTGKKNKKIRDQSNVRFMSPRIAPLMPDSFGTKSRHLSPSVLAFYNDDADGGVASIPKILEATGMTTKDRDSVIEMLMEVSGARKNVNFALDIMNHLNFRGLKGEIIEVTERLTDAFKTLEKSFLHYQHDDIKTRGFTFLEPHQLDRIYKDHGIKAADEIEFSLGEYQNLTRSEKEEALWERFELLAENTTQTHRRQKRTFQVLSVGAPTVLSPYMFMPIYGLSILGPVVLSPNIFSPLILNPDVLGPYVLSPAIAMPFILSPYVLSPYVLTPLVMAPFILTPYVLSPNVINPYVLSPIILSPLVLCPDILSPQTLGGGILSPSVASPPLFTESYLMASVLSPSVLS
ncbi:hypothetical protein QR680_015682 [Steinernema hermaphroditum]|uniref:Uncharacterized protein n=1 Tax=Steinernema hermaphroditum TaxID=289476 RepID=A0AA39H8N9_9BILA|nr:hypothetical protein QR680_015682 [Steinernema hermaphroditum]